MLAGVDAIEFACPQDALDALMQGHRMELLITKPRFAAGTQHGLSLAAMMKHRSPNLKVLFVTRAQHIPLLESTGDYVVFPCEADAVVAKALAMLRS